MNEYFSNVDFDTLKLKFGDEETCLKFLSEQKWDKGFVCRKCGNTNFCKGSVAFSRRCTRCKTQESATAHTMFHRCKLPLSSAFQIAWLVCKQPGISLQEISDRLNLRLMTVWKLRKKIEECMRCESGFLKPEQ
jgi:two-component system, sensor histidine kinase LadS